MKFNGYKLHTCRSEWTILNFVGPYDTRKHYTCMGMGFHVIWKPLILTSAQYRCLMLACPVTLLQQSYWTLFCSPHSISQQRTLTSIMPAWGWFSMLFATLWSRHQQNTGVWCNMSSNFNATKLLDIVLCPHSISRWRTLTSITPVWGGFQCHLQPSDPGISRCLMLACPVTLLQQSYWTMFCAPGQSNNGGHLQAYHCTGMLLNVTVTPLILT